MAADQVEELKKRLQPRRESSKPEVDQLRAQPPGSLKTASTESVTVPTPGPAPTTTRSESTHSVTASASTGKVVQPENKEQRNDQNFHDLQL